VQVDTRRQHKVAAGVWRERTHIVLDVWVCACSNEVTDNLRVEISGDRGPVKRSLSVLQQKEEKEENRELGFEKVNPKVRKETPCCQQEW
jgi:hypothetical protein